MIPGGANDAGRAWPGLAWPSLALARMWRRFGGEVAPIEAP